jgi:hypothetical protein
VGTAGAFRWARLLTTRLSARMPSSLALTGATMKDPYPDEKGQRELLKHLRATTEWDLNNPASF